LISKDDTAKKVGPKLLLYLLKWKVSGVKAPPWLGPRDKKVFYFNMAQIVEKTMFF